ncbi:hypothetical protein C8J57DRAFT_1519251 [Mycena rebaudengoi]|nr:hypothetical protein C8J57DRAFT_1519251 [Mycena rebaudengoi]
MALLNLPKLGIRTRRLYLKLRQLPSSHIPTSAFSNTRISSFQVLSWGGTPIHTSFLYAQSSPAPGDKRRSSDGGRPPRWAAARTDAPNITIPISRVSPFHRRPEGQDIPASRLLLMLAPIDPQIYPRLRSLQLYHFVALSERMLLDFINSRSRSNQTPLSKINVSFYRARQVDRVLPSPEDLIADGLRVSLRY